MYVIYMLFHYFPICVCVSVCVCAMRERKLKKKPAATTTPSKALTTNSISGVLRRNIIY